MSEVDKSDDVQAQDKTLSPSKLIALEFEGHQFSVIGDYWDATAMCQVYGKRVNNFLRIESTQRYLASLSRKLGIPIELDESKSAMTEGQGVEPALFSAMTQTQDSDQDSSNELKRVLIYKSKGGNVEESGTLVHCRIALKLAAWLNTDLEVWVYEKIEELLIHGRVELSSEEKESFAKLQVAFVQSEALREETAVELAIASHRLDQTRYERDELQEIAQWRRDNCWDAEAKLLDDEEE